MPGELKPVSYFTKVDLTLVKLALYIKVSIWDASWFMQGLFRYIFIVG
jgi:hypothetical protein